MTSEPLLAPIDLENLPNWEAIPTEKPTTPNFTKMAAMHTQDNDENIIFIDDKFYKYDANLNLIDGYPKLLCDEWNSLPESYCNGIDAGFYWDIEYEDDIIYLFKD